MNLVELFDSGRRRVPATHPFLGKRPVVSRNPLKYADYYEWWSWETVDLRRRHLGSALHKLFADGTLVAAPLKSVGIYSGNCPGTRLGTRRRAYHSSITIAWQLIDLATQAYELISVSLYDTLGKDTVGQCFFVPHERRD